MKYPRRRLLGISVGLLAATGAATWFATRRFEKRGFPRFSITKTSGLPKADAGPMFRFFATGDTGQSSAVRTEVIASMAQINRSSAHELIVSLGDNVYPDGVQSVDDPAWQEHFVDAFGSLGLPVYPCLGNHDHSGSTQAQVDYSKHNPLWIFPSEYHSFSLPIGASASVEFFVLDTQPMRTGMGDLFGRSDQLKWLSKALFQSSATWKIVCGHHPIYSGGPKGGSSKIARQLEPIIIEHAVDFYLSGHNHTLEVIDPASGYIQVVSGAAAAPDEIEIGAQTELMMRGGGYCSIALDSNTAWIDFIAGKDSHSEGIRLDRLASQA